MERYPGVDGEVFAAVEFDDGAGPAVYLGGAFSVTRPDGSVVKSLARWKDDSWSGMADGVSRASGLAVFDDGGGPDLYVAGNLRCCDGEEVLRWTPSGWEDIGSQLVGPFGQECRVARLRVLDLGQGPRLFVMGKIASAGGVNVKNIASWDGHKWSAIPMNNSEQTWDAEVLSADGGSLYVAGDFWSDQYQWWKPGLCRWDGQSVSRVLPTRTRGFGALQAYDDGTGPALYFEAWENQEKFGRFDGKTWTPVSLGFEFNAIPAMTVQDFGAGARLFIATDDTSKAPSRVLSFGPGGAQELGASNHEEYHTLAPIQGPDGPSLIVGGAFRSVGSASSAGVARWNGQEWSGAPPGVLPRVDAMVLHDDGTGPHIYVAGLLGVIGGQPAGGVARQTANGFEPVGGTLVHDTTVWTMSSFDDGAGPALFLGQTARNSDGFVVLRFDGSVWSGLGNLQVSLAHVFALAVFDDGTGPALYAGGAFDDLGGAAASNIARWNGVAWKPVGGGTDGDVLALHVHDDGGGPALYASGRFKNAGGLPAPMLARWDGQQWSSVGTEQGGAISALGTLDQGADRRLIAAGYFKFQNKTVKYAAAWDGTQWASLGIPIQIISFSDFDKSPFPALATLSQTPRPMLFLGGSFTAVPPEGECEDFIAWDTQSWSDLGADTDFRSTAQLAIDDPSNPRVLVGGKLFSIGGVISPGVAMVRPCPSCPADCDGSNGLDLFDFLCFTNHFNASDPAADCTGEGTFDLFDFLCFVNAFNAGC